MMNRGMAKSPAQKAPDTGIQLESFILIKAEAELLKPLPTGDEPLPGDALVGINPQRYSSDPKKLRVDFVYQVPSEYLNLSVEYRLILLQIGEEPEDTDSFWRRMVARTVPSIVMPYVRELVHSLTGRMGSPGFLLPVLNYGYVFEPDEIEIGIIRPDDVAPMHVSDESPAAKRSRKADGKTRRQKPK
jgi:hypothetical protein